jgi:hypothetical protein
MLLVARNGIAALRNDNPVRGAHPTTVFLPVDAKRALLLPRDGFIIANGTRG